ncbi:MAG: 30S ribosomal protein S15 [Candidatus Levybacteria bacterium RIFCSPHIGHO2_01_FULL_36_15]|nr:MAG: 30S ribosomal protein S15 [Candidatus Levybacteria bacterium RIFCSPHIGHO2_01_FULL_36_15]OGH38870.1 MAG: 30S ribosomal protein S15 [Candidatus Levybacteria bacterium RIFCSPLOWO2_01_FULL_36_10]
MPLTSDEKKKIIKDFSVVQGDTGSPEVQIALLTHKIQKLTDHLKIHAKDFHSRRGLLNMLSKRRRLFNFLVKMDKKRSDFIGKKIGLA